MNHLLEFYGEECPHCIKMHDLVKRLKDEEKIEIEASEVWHNDDNAKRMKEYDKDYCGGVPFFINTKTSKWICGQTTYEELKKWASGES